MMKPLLIVAGAGVLMAGAFLYWQSQQATPLAVGTDGPGLHASVGRPDRRGQAGEPARLQRQTDRPCLLLPGKDPWLNHPNGRVP